MATDKDVLLAIRASVQNVQSIQQVATAIGQITTQLQNQVAAALKGEGSIEDLKRSYEALKTAGADIAKTQVKIDVFKGQEAALDSARQRLAAATAEVQRLQAAMVGIEAPTKAQTRALERANTEQTRASTAAQNALKAYETTATALERLGVDTANVGQAIEQTNALWTRTTAVMALAKGATDQYSTSLQQFKTASAAAAQQTRDEEKALREKEATARSLAAFRSQGTAALSAQAGLLTTGTPAASISAQSQVADALERITAPAQAARRTLQGLELQIQELAAASVRGGKTTQDYADILRGLGAAQTALGRQGAAVDQFVAQTAAVQAAKAALDANHTSVFNLATAVRSAAVEDDQLVASLRRAQQALAASNATYQTQVGILRQYDAALKAAGIDTGNLGQVQQRLLASANTLAPAITRLARLVREGDTPGGPPMVLGLRPYQLQNLGFQINDVFTQLASGTSITQTLAQQGGQILQIFPGAFSAILRFLPPIIAGLVLVGTSVATIIEKFRELGALREFTGLLTQSQSGVQYQAAALVAAQKSIRDYGASFTDAGLAIREFLEKDINPTRIIQFGKAAQDIVDVYGGKLPEAAKTLTTAFQGSITNIIEFNDKFKTLNTEQLRYVQLLFDTGKAEEGRALALDISTKALQARADVTRGPLVDATRALEKAWHDFLETLGQTSIYTGAVNLLTRAINGLRIALGGLSAEEVLAKTTANIATLQGRIAEIGRDPRYAQTGAAGERARARDLATLNDEIDKQFAAIARLQQANQQGAAAANTAAQAVTGQGEASKNLSETIRGERRDRDAVTTATTAQTEAADRFLRAQTLENLQRIEAKKLTQAQIQQLADLVALKKREEALALKLPDTAVNEAARIAREAELERIRRARETTGAAARTAEESLVSMMNQFEAKITSNQKAELDQRLLQFDEWLRKIRVKIADAKRAGATSAGGLSFEEADARAVGLVDRARNLERLKASEQELNELIRARNDLVAANNARVAEGSLTQTEANTANAAAFASTNAAIVEGAANWLKYAEAARAAGDISQIALDAIAAKVKLIGDQAKFADPAMKELRTSIQNALVTNTLNFFNEVGEALGGLIAGTKTWSETFKALGQATAKFFAGLLKDIAAAILKMQLLKLLDSAFPGSGILGLFGLGGSAAGGAGAAAETTAGFGDVPFFFGHGGGVVGQRGGLSGSAPASLWTHAPRYHEGTPGVGLSADERRAVLRVGEEVLTKDDPRNVLNAGKGGSGGADRISRFKQVLLLDPKAVPEAMVTGPGEEAILTVISRNAPTIRQMVGVR